MPWPEADPGPRGDDPGGVNTDLAQLVAAAADLCRKPLRHAVLEAEPGPEGRLASGERTESESSWSESFDRCLLLQVRSPEGERLSEEDLELELYRSGDDLHLTLAWASFEERPMLWQGRHPVWMDGASGARCERPPEGLPLEALARRLRALLVG
jgi:hypothetical protein